jgi:hypothetical protein
MDEILAKYRAELRAITGGNVPTNFQQLDYLMTHLLQFVAGNINVVADPVPGNAAIAAETGVADAEAAAGRELHEGAPVADPTFHADVVDVASGDDVRVGDEHAATVDTPSDVEPA